MCVALGMNLGSESGMWMDVIGYLYYGVLCKV